MGLGMSMTLSVEEKGKKAPGWSLESDSSGEWSLQDLLNATKQSLILVSQEVLKEELNNGFDKGHIAKVDNSFNKTIFAVSPLGKIEFIARAEILDIVLETYSKIISLSRVGATGQYIDYNYVFVNNKEVARDLNDLKRWIATGPVLLPNDIIRMVNLMPYARSLERKGVTSKRILARTVKSRDPKQRSGPTVDAPNGTYFLATRAAARKYKSNVFLRFEYIPGGKFPADAVPTRGRNGKRLRKTYSEKGRWPKGGHYLYPSIKIGVSSKGTF
jgi:hypothetical protein